MFNGGVVDPRGFQHGFNTVHGSVHVDRGHTMRACMHACAVSTHSDFVLTTILFNSIKDFQHNVKDTPIYWATSR